MNKGETIRRHIAKGLSDGVIMKLVDTTVNSIRWHRSRARRPTAPEAGALTVGDALGRFGLGDELRTALTRLGVSDPEDLYGRLAAWTFVTNGRASARFGQCRYRTRTIEVHVSLLGLPEDLRLTLLHECAHALDMMVNGSSGHGAPWRRIMVALGLPPRTSGGHTAAASDALRSLRAERAVEIWECARCGAETPIMRKRKYPAERYSHPKCGGRFRVRG